MKSSSGERPWSFLTNHARVFAFIAEQPRARVRDIAAGVGVTERTAIQIVGDLERAGFLSKIRDGRRNTYAIKALAASQILPLVLEALEKQPFS
jgi:hypothetical protein